jgi:hypothetical protein
MNFFTKSYDQLIDETISILLQVKDNIKEDSVCICTYYETAEQMHNEIDKYIQEFKKGNLLFLDEVCIHFSPTAAYQEHSIANNWTTEYLNLAVQFDKVCEAIKKYN